MIRLNLTNQPGLQSVDEAEQFDLEGLIPDEKPGEQAGAVPAEPGSGEQAGPEPVSVPGLDDIVDLPVTPPQPEGSPDVKIDDDLFKLAEANLDLIEQAEEEETGKKVKVKEAPEPEEKPVKTHKKQPLLRYGILVAGIVVLFVILWLYKNGQLTREKVRKTAQEATETVSKTVADKAGEVMQTADELSDVYADKVTKTASQLPGAARQLSADVSDVTRQMSSELSDTRQQIATKMSESQFTGRSVKRVYGTSDISIDLIQRVQVGQYKLSLAADVLAQFPQDARLQYLRVKNDKLSFILYVSSESVAERIKNYFMSQSRFLPPDVFFIERTERVIGNPVEIMAIIRFRPMGSDDTKGYKYLTDRQLSQYIWQASLKSSVQMSPLKISSSDITRVRDAEITGNGWTANVITMLRELAVQRHNMSAAMLSIKSDTNRPIGESVLNFDLNSVIYPGNM